MRSAQDNHLIKIGSNEPTSVFYRHNYIRNPGPAGQPAYPSVPVTTTARAVPTDGQYRIPPNSRLVCYDRGIPILFSENK